MPMKSAFLFLLALSALSFSCKVPEPAQRPAQLARTFFFNPAELSDPFGIAESGGQLLVSDGERGRIMRVTNNGEFSVVASGLKTPSHIAVSESGDIFVADSGSHTIKRVTRAGEASIFAGVDGKAGFSDGPANAALFRAPIGIAVRGASIYVADTYNDRIRVIENGNVRTIAGGVRGFADSSNGSSSRFDTPTGLAFGTDGSLLVCDPGHGRVRAVQLSGTTKTLIGGGGEFADGSADSAGLYQPLAIAVSGNGEIWFTDGSAVRRVDLTRAPTVVTVSSQRAGFADGAAADGRFNRPGGIAIAPDGAVFVADSENQALRSISPDGVGKIIDPDTIADSRPNAADFRTLAPARWPYDPPQNTREIAGTLGEIRGENDGGDEMWFHNGLDVVGAYGETARFVRDETVLRPLAAENFGTLRELIRMPTLGYIHIRLGRDSAERGFGDPRFVFDSDESGKTTGVRVPRGSRFTAGEPIGTLNPMNHVHLIAGRSGAEFNALAALDLPGVSDKIAPVVESVELTDENFGIIETGATSSRIKLVGKTRIVARAFDRMDGNAERRRLGIYRAGYQLLQNGEKPVSDPVWPITFDRLPGNDAVGLVYDRGSKSGATGETIFRYVVTNEVHANVAREGFIDPLTLEPGTYTLRVLVADYFGNIGSKDLAIEIPARQ